MWHINITKEEFSSEYDTAGGIYETSLELSIKRRKKNCLCTSAIENEKEEREIKHNKRLIHQEQFDFWVNPKIHSCAILLHVKSLSLFLWLHLAKFILSHTDCVYQINFIILNVYNATVYNPNSIFD